MAMAVPSRLWLGGVVSQSRDLALITAVVAMVRRAAKGMAPGLRRWAGQLRDRLRPGLPRPGADRPARPAAAGGRPRAAAGSGDQASQRPPPGGRHPAGGLGTAGAIAGVLSATGTGTGINTSYIERLNATFRSSMCPLVRRGRAIARGEAVLTGWMYLVGCAYNFCWEHDSLRVAAPAGGGLKWRARTPAMAAGLTDHRWTMHELLSQPIPLPPWTAPKRRGRDPPHPGGDRSPTRSSLAEAVRLNEAARTPELAESRAFASDLFPGDVEVSTGLVLDRAAVPELAAWATSRAADATGWANRRGSASCPACWSGRGCRRCWPS